MADTTVTDVSENGNDGTIVGGCTANNGYMTFPGGDGSANNYVSMPVIDWTKYGAVTISIDLKQNVDQGNYFTYGFCKTEKRNSPDPAGYMFLNANRPDNAGARFAITSSAWRNEEEVVAPSVMRGQWSHIVVTIDGKNAKIYKDGKFVAENSWGMSFTDLGTTEYNWLARSPYGGDWYWAGDISDFRIYGTALSEQKVEALYQEVEADRESLFPEHPLNSTIESGEGTVQYLKDGKPVSSAHESAPVTLRVEAADGYEIGKIEWNGGLQNASGSSFSSEFTVGSDSNVRVWFDPTDDKLTMKQISESEREGMNYVTPGTGVDGSWDNYLTDGDAKTFTDISGIGTYYVFDAGENAKFRLSSVIMYSREDFAGRLFFTLWGADSLESIKTHGTEGSDCKQMKDSSGGTTFGGGSANGNNHTGNSRVEYDLSGNPSCRYVVLQCENERPTAAGEIKFYGKIVPTHHVTIKQGEQMIEEDVEDGKVVVCSSDTPVAWTIDGKTLAIGKKFRHIVTGDVTIEAVDPAGKEADGVAVQEGTQSSDDQYQFVANYGVNTKGNITFTFVSGAYKAVKEVPVGDYAGKQVEFTVNTGGKTIDYVVAQ